MRTTLIGLVLLIPLAPAPAQDSSSDNPIDRHLSALWKEKGIAPAEPAGDTEFIRRVTLDLIGRTPTADEARAFVKDSDRDKRARKFEELIASPEFIPFWAERLTASFLGYPRDYEYLTNRAGFTKWLEQKLEDKAGYDSIASRLITASGEFKTAPEVSYLTQFLSIDERKYGLKIEELTGRTSTIFLGIRIQCAQCHDHPFDGWTQDDFYGMAGFFKRTGSGQEGGITNHGRDLTYAFEHYKGVLEPRFLDGTVPGEAALRDEFARIAIASPYFARATVNRFWAYFFGRGIVTPYDDFNGRNKPVSEPLLDELSKEFVRRKFNVRWLMRTIVSSQAYQRTSAQGAKPDRNAEKFFARSRLRPLTPEQLFNAIAGATDLAHADFDTKSVMRLRSQFFGYAETDTYRVIRRWFINLMVKTSSADTPEALSDYTANTQQVLHSLNINSPIYAGAKVNGDGRLDQVLESNVSAKRSVEDLYWWALSRAPTERELEVCVAHISDNKDSPRSYEQVFWALLNTDEFIFNH